MNMMNDSTLDSKLSAIDKALAAAKARKAMKDSQDAPQDAAEKNTTKVVTDNVVKAAKNAERDATRESARAQRTKEREARRAAKATDLANKKPAHMKKIASAAAKLPTLSQSAQILFSDITSNLPNDQVIAVALHLQHFNRTKATERALGQRVTAGQQVRITAGDPRYVGKTGTIARAQRIRCYVTIPGIKREVYLFTSDVEIVESAAKTGTEG